MINFTVVDCAVRNYLAGYSPEQNAHEKKINLAVLRGKTYTAAPQEHSREIIPDLTGTLIVTWDAKLTGYVLRRNGIAFDRIVGLADLIHYVDGAGADCTLKTFAVRHHLYFRDTGALEDRMRLVQTAARVYLPKVPAEEITLISHTHHLYFNPVLVLRVEDLLDAKSKFVAATKGNQYPGNTTLEPVSLFQITVEILRFDQLISMGSKTDGKLPVYLNYYGAFSGRFSGGNGFNIQGLPRPNAKQHPLIKQAAKAIRAGISVFSGYHLISADVNAMEPRITAWLSHNAWMEECFEKSLDLYQEFGKRVNPLIWTRTLAQNPALNDTIRQMTKRVFLATQYGAGAYRLWRNLREQLEDGEIADLFEDERQQRMYCLKAVAIAKSWGFGKLYGCEVS